MLEDTLTFIRGFGEIVGKALASFKIPGTNWSALGFMLGIFLIGFVIKILKVLFGSASFGGGSKDDK